MRQWLILRLLKLLRSGPVFIHKGTIWPVHSYTFSENVLGLVEFTAKGAAKIYKKGMY